MTALTPPEREDYRAHIAEAIRETHLAIRKAMRYIRRHEDGPVTMYHALKVIAKRVTDIQLEASYQSAELERMQKLTAEAYEQRDEAIRQRDLALSLLNSRKKRRRRRRQGPFTRSD